MSIRRKVAKGHMLYAHIIRAELVGGKCACGETSPKGLSDYEITKWHRAHKSEIQGKLEHERKTTDVAR